MGGKEEPSDGADKGKTASLDLLVAKRIFSHLQDAQLSAASVPSYERFREEPFLTLDQALKEIEAALPAHHRIALANSRSWRRA